jgi:hypothetical protein
MKLAIGTQRSRYVARCFFLVQRTASRLRYRLDIVVDDRILVELKIALRR